MGFSGRGLRLCGRCGVHPQGPQASAANTKRENSSDRRVFVKLRLVGVVAEVAQILMSAPTCPPIRTNGSMTTAPS